MLDVRNEMGALRDQTSDLRDNLKDSREVRQRHAFLEQHQKYLVEFAHPNNVGLQFLDDGPRRFADFVQ